MVDDLANYWGTIYCLPNSRGNRGSCPLELQTIFKHLMERMCQHKFFVAKCCPSGTDANMWSLFEATGSVSSSCAVAAGCYVGGEGSLQSWSTSHFCNKHNVCRLKSPSEATDIAKEITLPLPYYIPSSAHMKDTLFLSNLEYLEDMCLKEIHLRCIKYKLDGKPLKALLMEILLAANGGELSNRFLIALAKLAKHHEFCIIVDEIMTGGRATTQLLLTLTTPVEFQEAVRFVTLGKWMGIGVCLENVKYKSCADDQLPNRGLSTLMNIANALDCVRYIEQNISSIPNRRGTVLKKLKVTEEQAWGKGLIVFIPKRRSDSLRALKNRYLPMLSSSPISTIPMHGKSEPKEDICKRIREYVALWILHSRQTGTRVCRILIERLVDITQKHDGSDKQEHFVGRYELQSFLKQKLFKESQLKETKHKSTDSLLIIDENHLKLDMTSTITITQGNKEADDNKPNCIDENCNKCHDGADNISRPTNREYKVSEVETVNYTINIDDSNCENKEITSLNRSSDKHLSNTTIYYNSKSKRPITVDHNSRKKCHQIKNGGSSVQKINVSNSSFETKYLRKNESNKDEESKINIEETCIGGGLMHHVLNINGLTRSENTELSGNGRIRSIEDTKSEVNHIICLAESVGLLDYKFVKGKKRLRRLIIRQDCCFPLLVS